MLIVFTLALSLFLTPLSSATGNVLHSRGGLACSVPLIASLFCPSQSGEVQLLTPSGIAKGSRPSQNGPMRFSVKYATSQRWQRSVVAHTWQTPNGDSTSLPPKCPQNGVDPSSYKEDCLYMTLYVPASALPVVSGLPVIVWVHGGSFVLGSSTDPGLDGSNLAAATKSIVVVVQYRLGALGWLPPDSANVNLGLRDMINALQFLRSNVISFGGDANKVTLAGQSSGAYLIRSLLGTPSAQSLFKSVILHSDPVNFGFDSPSTFTALQDAFFTTVSCSKTDTTCQNSLSLSAILSASASTQGSAASIDPAAGSAQPIRVVKDGSLVTTTLTGTSFPPTTKPMMITTVQAEAGAPIYGPYPSPLPDLAFPQFVYQVLGSERATTILSLNQYHYSASTGGVGDGDDARRALQVLFTDYYYRCPSWTLARSYASLGGQPYVGVFTVGATYTPLQVVAYCAAGAVCHQSDIFIVFGTTPSPTSAQTALTGEIQARYASFLKTSNPNPSGSSLAVWNPSGATVNALQLGGSGNAPTGACDPSSWGASVPYDYQVFNQ